MNNKKENQLEHNQFEKLIIGLLTNQFGCSDDFLNRGTVTGLRNNIEDSISANEFQVAGIGNKTETNTNGEVRGDKIKWIEKDSIDEFEMVYLKKVESFIEHLNETCYTSINAYESHYANYEQKRFYKRHLDQFKNDRGRKYSVVVYLNENWLSKDGGLLSLYPSDKVQQDIAPIAGRMVFFKSDEMEHEVHPSFTRERKSIAGWFKS